MGKFIKYFGGAMAVACLVVGVLDVVCGQYFWAALMACMCALNVNTYLNTPTNN